MPFQTDPSWTPSRYRKALEVWRVTAPANDSDIFTFARRSESPRHARLSESLRMVLRWRDPPGLASPLSSNWMLVPDNDNATPNDFRIDVIREISPTPEEMIARTAGVAFDTRPEPAMLATGKLAAKRTDREVHSYPVGGDIECAAGNTTRLGKLYFSNGKQTESCVFLGPDDKTIKGQARVPAGGLLRAAERSTRSKGQATNCTDLRASNDFVAATLRTQAARYILAGRKKVRRAHIPNPALPATSLSFSEAREFARLEPVMIDTNTALPCGRPAVADSFLGLRKGSFAGGGSQAWQDIAAGITYRQDWEMIVESLLAIDVAVLDAAVAASRFEDIGMIAGYTGEYARKAGKRILLAANANLERAAEKFAG